MNILHLLDERWDSGLTQYALQIATHLKNHNHNVVLGVLSGKKPEKMAREKGLKTVSVDSALQVRRLIQDQSWDVINVHTGRMHSLSLLFASPKTPVIRTRGDARPLHANIMSRFIYGRTKAVIAASEHIATYYADFEFPEDKIKVIYPSILADSSIVPLPSYRVGILGRLDPVKGHTFFLEAAADVLRELPQTKFLIAGKEANVSFSLLQNQIRALGLESSVEYLGFQASALDFMRSCTIGVIASIGSEEISRACLEWMSVGRPVVGTLVGCLPELIEPEETGLLVPAGNGSALGEAILKLLRDPQVVSSWGRHANSVIQNKFSSKIQLEKTLEVYHYAMEDSVAHSTR